MRDKGWYWRAIDTKKKEERSQRLWDIHVHGVHVITECFIKNCSSPNCTCTYITLAHKHMYVKLCHDSGLYALYKPANELALSY